ncbi:MAG: saccharopine dehydrogenase [Pirellulaceae bacterium]
MPQHLWLRAESKPREQRRVVTPRHARQLLDAGFTVTVEASGQSAIDDQCYVDEGCPLVAPHSWKTDAPAQAIIVGLKELEDSELPLKRRHVHFAHVYKNQAGWENTLLRFIRGGGTLYDLEYLVNENGARVAAFGYWAGYAGAALALLAWARQQVDNRPIESVDARPSQHVLLQEVQSLMDTAGQRPRVLVIGALGRSGRGAVDFCEAAGAEIVPWDLAETQGGGPFAEILEFDIFLNCVFVKESIPPFINQGLLQTGSRRLTMISDISCDPYGAYNPLPIYDRCTTFDEPVSRLIDGDQPLDLIAIDHLPSLLPVESSEDFSEQLLPYLLQLADPEHGVWQRAADVFRTRTESLNSMF